MIGDAPAQLPLSPAVRKLEPYPFARLAALKEEVESRGVSVVDLSIGDIKEPTPEVVRRALREGLGERSSYPAAVGLPKLRRAISDWFGRRFGVELDPDREVLPSNGSKEAVFTLPLAVVDPVQRPLVLVPDPAYPVYALGTAAAGGETLRIPLRADRGFLPDLGAVPEETWRRASLLWINYPNNPTGAVAPPSFFEEAARLCRKHGVLLASDEAYTELYFGEPPRSALEQGSENILVLHTLSKRSAMPGYRTGFIAGDARLIEALKRFRPGVGVATPQFIQEAAAAAWADEVHVDAIRARFRERRDLMANGLRALGLEVGSAPASIYLWVRIPGSESSEAFVLRALEAGVLLLPGAAMGPAGEGFFRLSLTAELDELRESLARLGRVLGG